LNSSKQITQWNGMIDAAPAAALDRLSAILASDKQATQQ
jgi:hypothetical protein